MEKRIIEKNFNAIAEIYDSQRRALIPCFESFYETIVEAIPPINAPKILDIGAGTGLLSHLILNRFDNAQFTLIDISADMLSQARERFGDNDNFTYIEADYSSYSFTKPYDIVVSSLSIHHLTDEEKAKLYKCIYTQLNNGGIFINGDQFLSRTIKGELRNMEWWRHKIEATELSPTDIVQWEKRVAMDIPATVEQNIIWFESAGFTEVELLFKMYNFGVIAGKKE